MLVQLSTVLTAMPFAGASPVFTVTSPPASMPARSLTFTTAFFAVGEHTPLAQLMFAVGLDEIVTSALAAVPASTAAKAVVVRNFTARISVAHKGRQDEHIRAAQAAIAGAASPPPPPPRCGCG